MSSTPIAAAGLSACDREPIHIPGSIQPHGFLFAVSATDHRILQVSSNAPALLQLPLEQLLGQTLDALLPESARARLQQALSKLDRDGRVHYLRATTFDSVRYYDMLAHESEGLILIEFEPVERPVADFSLLYPLLNNFLSQVHDGTSVVAMSQLACAEIKRLTGFGRVLVYRFDAEGHGHVLAEEREPDYHSYLNQRFPASDIPQQARALYLNNRLRLISNADYEPAPLLPHDNPVTGLPTDLSHAVLRSVSPVHLQYMRNMGTPASMSASLVVKGRLWGLISCHHAAPRLIPFEVRTACEQLAQVLALRIESREDKDEYQDRLELRRTLVSMLGRLTRSQDFIHNMGDVAPELLRLVRAAGAALVVDERIECYGDTPPKEAILQLADWLGSSLQKDIFHTDSLSASFPNAGALTDKASGLLAIPISRLHPHYLIWFRPEMLQTIEWAGRPQEPTLQDGPGQAALTPRTSFALWRQTVACTSAPWLPSEIEIALEFRTALLESVLERAESMAELAHELGRANKELEAFSYSVSHDLRAPLRHIAGFADLLLQFQEKETPERNIRFIRNIQESARFAGKLVDDLLSFSQMGRASLRPCNVDMQSMVEACREKLQDETRDREIAWDIPPLPVIQADPNFLQLAIYNLLSNAVKYTGNREKARISVRAEQNERETCFHFEDNGIGFDMEYVNKLFGVFQRLHRMEDFPGTGIGLANVRRIIERHGGRVWAEGSEGQGAIISFALPRHLKIDLTADE